MTGNEKSIVETTLLQIKAVEDAISENAKGILQSTMKEEISELVKESLSGSKKSKKSLYEQAEDPTMGVNDEEGMDDMDTEMDTEVDTEVDSELDMSDLEGIDDMDTDMEVDTEVDMDNEDEMPPLDMTSSSPEEVLKVFKAMGDDDGIIVKKDGSGNLHLEDNENGREYIIQMENDKRREKRMNSRISEEIIYELSIDDDGFEDLDEMDTFDFDEKDEVVYELEMEEGEMEDMDEMYEDDDMMESFKPKGRVGRMNFKYPSKLKKGVTETSDDEEEMGEWSEEEDDEIVPEKPTKIKSPAETTEASRTITYRRRAERDRVAAPSQVRSESVIKEMNLLKEKNEEYKKALDFFRNKLNEVAVFNSNLAYSTRLFTEHSTTKQEKINILRRFDNVESLKESKNLYKSIKEELGGKNSNEVVSESITNKVIKTPSNGSASNLIESKTYENPQFMRMKDLMTKIK
jgi:hypothetical protein